MARSRTGDRPTHILKEPKSTENRISEKWKTVNRPKTEPKKAVGLEKKCFAFFFSEKGTFWKKISIFFQKRRLWKIFVFSEILIPHYSRFLDENGYVYIW